MALWGYNFNREARWQKNRKGFAIFYISAMFIFPSLIYYLLGNPAVTNYYLKNVMPVEYPPESDPSIISKIYYAKDTENDKNKKRTVVLIISFIGLTYTQMRFYTQYLAGGQFIPSSFHCLTSQI